MSRIDLVFALYSFNVDDFTARHYHGSLQSFDVCGNIGRHLFMERYHDEAGLNLKCKDVVAAA